MYAKKDLSKIWAKAQLSKPSLEHYVDALDETIKKALARVGTVTLPGMGIFTLEEQLERKKSPLRAKHAIAFIPLGVLTTSIH